MSLSDRQLKAHCRSNSVEKTPSSEDIATTRRLKEAGDLLGIHVQEHIIVDTDTGENSSSL
jgi:DNA repair protein RadC